MGQLVNRFIDKQSSPSYIGVRSIVNPNGVAIPELVDAIKATGTNTTMIVVEITEEEIRGDAISTVVEGADILASAKAAGLKEIWCFIIVKGNEQGKKILDGYRLQARCKAQKKGMNEYRELQRKLKELRVSGVKLEVKLNAKKDVLQRELQRLNN